LLSDRIVMMTNGPAATIGEILAVLLERPRDRVDWRKMRSISDIASRYWNSSIAARRTPS
jgi:ABC-type nitrate/sulfonate/bicarbonate transport system ATPase subunit